MESARTLADALFFRDPYRVKDFHVVQEPIHLNKDPIMEPEFMPLEEQTELFAQRIKKLGRFQFLLRSAIAEGHIGQDVLPLSIQDLDRDKATGEYQLPDAPLMHRLRTALAKQSGTPMQRLLQEQEKRLPQAVPEPIRRLTPAQPRHRQPQPNGHREQQPTGATPALPAGSGEQPNHPRHQRRYRKD
jgi:hypothetical protein